jgi:hypothetical protein
MVDDSCFEDQNDNASLWSTITPNDSSKKITAVENHPITTTPSPKPLSGSPEVGKEASDSVVSVSGPLDLK